ncbi:MAG: hypothetical protein QGG36_00305 [Pirellulaceae bacterium]|jgi:hypothetical protein|nr:hypothetical protein [Pirellulaceae bacterium]MDP7014217.1 hypothetical protein [Pirellulaceae bacterium]
MTTHKSLPENPSLDYERKQAKALVRAVKADDAEAIARVRLQLPNSDPPISLRDAQLVIALEYGFAGWAKLKAAILQSSGRGLEVAYREACRAIDANEVETLKALITEFPDLLTVRQPEWPEVLLQQTTSYANFPGAENEDHYNRPQCAELLLDAGAVVDPRVYLRLIDTGAHKMLALFEIKGALPDNLRVVTALGDQQRVAACFEGAKLLDSARPSSQLLNAYDGVDADWPDPKQDYQIIADAFLYACRLAHREIAAALLQRCTALDADLARRIKSWEGSAAFIDFLIARAPAGSSHDFGSANSGGEPGMIWQRAVELRLQQALEEADVDAFREILQSAEFLLESRFLEAQVRILELAAYSENCREIIAVLLDSGAAVATAEPPESHAVSWAIEYGNTDYIPLLARIWPVPDDLPHAAGVGDMANVAKWFTGDGSPQFEPHRHNPFSNHFPNASVQDILDRALAWAVINREYGIADFLLEHGADINTRWSTHEPASILHECAFDSRLEQVKYLVAKGVDLTIRNHRHQSTAEGWARYGGQSEVAEFLAAAADGAD